MNSTFHTANPEHQNFLEEIEDVLTQQHPDMYQVYKLLEELCGESSTLKGTFKGRLMDLRRAGQLQYLLALKELLEELTQGVKEEDRPMFEEMVQLAQETYDSAFDTSPKYSHSPDNVNGLNWDADVYTTRKRIGDTLGTSA